MPKYWLMKSEADVYPLDALRKDETTFWDGIRNYAARNFLREMKVGDLALFYHSNADPSAAVGIMRIVKEARPDPTQFEPGDEMHYDPKSKRDDPRWFGVEVGYVEHFAEVVTLAQIKATPSLKNMKLLKVSRLSVSPVTPREWKTILSLAKTSPRTPRASRPRT